MKLSDIKLTPSVNTFWKTVIVLCWIPTLCFVMYSLLMLFRIFPSLMYIIALPISAYVISVIIDNAKGKKT